MSLEVSSKTFERVLEGQILALLNFDGITCEAIWSWAFVFWEIFYDSFNFSACNWVVHNFYFFLVQSWKIELF